MSWFGKYWKVILAVLLLIAAVLAVLLVLRPQDKAMAQELESTAMMTDALQTRLNALLAENAQLAAIKDELPGAIEDVAAAREEISDAMELMAEDRVTLYASFPGGLKEEDQILYVMDLEDLLDMEMMFGRVFNSAAPDQTFEFGTSQGIIRLTDGAVLYAVNINVDFDMSYEAFKQMLVYLATDERITSIHYTKIDYDAQNDRVVGYATLLYYYLESEDNAYVGPEMDLQTGKDTLFE